jgi:hypothetical protein
MSPRLPGPKGLLIVLLVSSIVLRFALVRGGGQYYWPDENWYEQAQEIVRALDAGDRAAAIERLERAGPLLFKIAALVPAAIEYRFGENPHVPGWFFAACSVVNIWLLGHIATALGASAVEALLASTLLALSSSFFYYSRHLLPYDLAMTFGLVAIDFGVRGRSMVGGSIGSGLLAACCLLAYNGYWTMASVAVLVTVTTRSQSWREAVARTVIAGAAACSVLAAVIGTNALLGGRMVQNYRTYVTMVTQGSFDEGWRLPFEYLWHAEHGLLVVWIGSIALCVIAARQWQSLTAPRVQAGLLGLLSVYAALALSSTVFHAFVVYGRLARQLVPFFCLVSAFVLARLWQSRRVVLRSVVPLTIVLLIAQSASNFREPLRQTFPDDLEHKYGPSGTSRLTWVNVEHIYPEPRRIVLPDDYVLVHQAPHPLQFLPYQYEGYTPEQRQRLRSTDIRMRLIGPAPR